MNKKVLVAMSGGVDSSVAAFLLILQFEALKEKRLLSRDTKGVVTYLSKFTARRIGGIFSVIRYKNSSQRYPDKNL